MRTISYAELKEHNPCPETLRDFKKVFGTGDVKLTKKNLLIWENHFRGKNQTKNTYPLCGSKQWTAKDCYELSLVFLLWDILGVNYKTFEEPSYTDLTETTWQYIKGTNE